MGGDKANSSCASCQGKHTPKAGMQVSSSTGPRNLFGGSGFCSRGRKSGSSVAHLCCRRPPTPPPPPRHRALPAAPRACAGSSPPAGCRCGQQGRRVSKGGSGPGRVREERARAYGACQPAVHATPGVPLLGGNPQVRPAASSPAHARCSCARTARRSAAEGRPPPRAPPSPGRSSWVSPASRSYFSSMSSSS